MEENRPHQDYVLYHGFVEEDDSHHALFYKKSDRAANTPITPLKDMLMGRVNWCQRISTKNLEEFESWIKQKIKESYGLD